MLTAALTPWASADPDQGSFPIQPRPARTVEGRAGGLDCLVTMLPKVTPRENRIRGTGRGRWYLRRGRSWYDTSGAQTVACRGYGGGWLRGNGNSMEAHQHVPVCMHASGHPHVAGETYAHWLIRQKSTQLRLLVPDPRKYSKI